MSITAPYADIEPFVAALLLANSDRVVCGSDWPYINHFDAAQVPDDGTLLNLLADWMPDEAMRNRVLVENAAKLYGFGPD